MSNEKHPILRKSSVVELLDDDIAVYNITDWRARNVRFYELLSDRGLIDAEAVPIEAHKMLTDSLIHSRVGAATDSQNGGHVRSQNENVVHYGLAAQVSRRTLTIALEAGFFHDLNKAIGEPLRSDEYAVRNEEGHVVPAMTTLAQIVGLNHLGDRTHRALLRSTRLRKGAIEREVAEAIDLCIVHHGLGSSKFIQDLVEGSNPWWGAEFVDPKTGERRLIHPKQPPSTLESVIHDLADSTQQMQGGAAWLMKYPSGFWSASGRSYADMMSGDRADTDGGVPMSLRRQIIVETQTCYGIIAGAHETELIDDDLMTALREAVDDATMASRQWINDSPDYLAQPDGKSVYHDLAGPLGVAPEEALTHLREAIPGTVEGDDVEDLIWSSGRRLDNQRARALAERIQTASHTR